MLKKVSNLRWLIMILSFITLTYGVFILGFRVMSFNIPTFICPINSEGILSSSCYNLSHMKYFLTGNWSSGNIIEIVKFFAVFFLFIFFLGRILCGFICPFGFIQDVINKLRILIGIKPIKFTEKIVNALKIVKWQILIIFVGGTFVSLDFCSWCPVLIFGAPMAGIRYGVYLSVAISSIIVITGSFFKRRFWCTICPLGFLIGIFNKISLFGLKKDCQACTECGACYEACPQGIKSIYTEREKKDITTADCIMCTECVNKCPEDKAIAISFAGKKIYTSSRSNFFNDQGINSNKISDAKFEQLFEKNKSTKN